MTNSPLARQRRFPFRPPAPGSSPSLCRGLAGLAALAILASACGSGGGGDGSTAADKGDGGGGATTSTPTDPLLDGLYKGRSQAEVDLEIETEVQKCMTALGWEYTAVDRSAIDPGGASVAATAIGGAEADEFAEQYGYGITTNGGIEATGVVGGGDSDDPNMAYVNGLPADQQEAYAKDLWGDPGEAGADGAITMTGGCYNEASEKVLGPGGFDQLNSQFEEVGKLVDADSRVVDANAAWAACMSGKGYSYSTPTDPIDDLFAKYQALGATPADADLQALQAEELATAKADRACAKEAKLDDAYQQAYADAAAQVAGK